MAAEAVIKIREAEEKGSEMIKSAGERAKEILKNAESDAAAKRKAIIDEANKMKAEIIDAAVRKAEQDCAGLVQQGDAEREKIKNPGEERLSNAAKLVIERIVDVNGNS